jgi:hypothetical protein
MTLLIETNADRWTRLTRGTGIAGLVSIVLLFAPIIAISSLGEPAFLASAEQARASSSRAVRAGRRRRRR